MNLKKSSTKVGDFCLYTVIQESLNQKIIQKPIILNLSFKIVIKG